MMTKREKSSRAFTTAALMVGLGTFMMLLSIKFLPSVWVASNRVEIGCQIVESSIREDNEKATFQIFLNLRWHVGDNDYGTSKAELWRESPKKSSSLDYLLDTYQIGNSRSCFYDEEYPARVFPEKAKATELWWLIFLAMGGVFLIGSGAIRILRHAKRPKRHTATIQDGVTYDYVPQTTTDISAITPALAVWRPVFEELGLQRPEEDTFRYSGTIDGVSIHVFLSDIDEETKILGYKRPPLTIRFDHPDGNREVFFWVRHRRRDDPIPTQRNFWASFDVALDPSVEITGYDEKVIASLLTSEARALLRNLVLKYQITIYAGHQKSVDLDTLSIADTAEGVKLLRCWIAWMSHVFSTEFSLEERLARSALTDPSELIQIHRLLLLRKWFPESDELTATLKQALKGNEGVIQWIAQALDGQHDSAKKVGSAIATHVEQFWTADNFSLPLALRYLHQLFVVLPSEIEGPTMEAMLLRENHSMVEEVLKIIERQKELSDASEEALIKRLKNAAYPIAMRSIHILGHRGSPGAIEAIEPYALGEFRLTDLAEAAGAAIENIKRREVLDSDTDP
jgi:hypothetical protein